MINPIESFSEVTKKISSLHSFLGPSYVLYKSATTGGSSKANNFQIVFGIALGPGAFLIFTGPKCHVCFPMCKKEAVLHLVHRDAVDIMWRKRGKWGCKTNKELIDGFAEVLDRRDGCTFN